MFHSLPLYFCLSVFLLSIFHWPDWGNCLLTEDQKLFINVDIQFDCTSRWLFIKWIIASKDNGDKLLWGDYFDSWIHGSNLNMITLFEQNSHLPDVDLSRCDLCPRSQPVGHRPCPHCNYQAIYLSALQLCPFSL